MRFLIPALALLLSGCGSRPAPPPQVPTVPTATSATEPEPSPVEEPATTMAVPPPPAACAALTGAEHVPDVAPPACDDSAALRAALAAALEEEDSGSRDRALAPLELCATVESGLVRALRADLGPRGCADVLTEPMPSGTLRRDVRDALTGLRIAAKLSRLVRTPPVLQAPYDKARFMDFFRNELVPWIAEQARAIFQLSSEGVRLRGYGQGLVAMEAGLADMRFVEVARGIPLPDEMKDDPELRDVYYGALEEALAPRKARGRDAALVGLRRFAELGVIQDPRVSETRALLSTLFGGRRIDALDGLLLPDVPSPQTATPEQRIVARAPTFYVSYLVPEVDFSAPGALAPLAARGVPEAVRARLVAGSLSADATKLLAVGLVRLGQTYWRAADFQAAKAVLSPLLTSKQRDADAVFLSRLAEVLGAGPTDAAEMMLKGPRYPEGVGSVGALDALARAKGTHAGAAAFDAAYLLRLVPPMDATPEYFDDVAARFRGAAAALAGARRTEAEASARAAAETAQAIREGAVAPPTPR